MSPIRYDFRSDTVTRPSAAMRTVMANAEVGDDVFGDDPTLNRLEALAADMLGKEAALFLPSGTQSNLTALMAHCGRGDEYIVGQNQHAYRWEAGGAAVLGSIQPQPLENEADGTIPLEKIEAAIKPDDFHYARTRLLSLENTIGGKVLSLEYMRSAVELARRHGLNTHLDGARIFNAATALGVPVSDVAAGFDSVSVCLSKGLGAPVGSVLVGRKDLIEAGRRIRKMLGGGMRQAGILAAAGIHALENNVDRLGEDHANALRLAEGLRSFNGLTLELPQTNILFVRVAPEIAGEYSAHLEKNGVGITGTYDGSRQRWVTHLDVDNAAIDAALAITRDFFAAR